MSAKDPRKALCAPLSPELAADLRAYARANGDTALAAAARRALRAELGVGRDNGSRSGGPAKSPERARAITLRLQLEPRLQARLRERGASPTDPGAIVALIAKRVAGAAAVNGSSSRPLRKRSARSGR